MTIKEQLLQAVIQMSSTEQLVTVETLDSGEYNEMTFFCPKDKLYELIDLNFNSFLCGEVPGGSPTKIEGWYTIESESILEE